MNQTKLALLDAHDWEPTILRLAAYVVKLCSFHRYKLPRHIDPEDIVVNAIEKVYNGERNWDPSADNDLGKYMASVVKSMVSNLMESRQLDAVDIDLVPVADQAELDKTLEYVELNNRIVEAIKDKPELALVFKELTEGYAPREIAEEYHLDISIVRNAQKKLRNVVTRIIEEI